MKPLKVHVNSSLSPNVDHTKQVELKNTNRLRRVAKHTVIRDGNTGEVHHDALQIKTYVKTKVACTVDPRRSVSLDGEETATLAEFLATARAGAIPSQPGAFVVMPVDGDAEVVRKLQDLADPGKLDALALLLRQVENRPDFLARLVDRLARDQGHLEKVAGALNLARYRRVVDRFEAMIEDPATSEHDLQKFLTSHPWLFGSEYSCILNRRRWTRDEVTDFVPLRTTDGRGELIEIKTPLNGRDLFHADRNHNTLYPGRELSAVVTQVANYLEKLDRKRDDILANDGIDVTKICAKAIIGRDNGPAQQLALRLYNGHLHRIEILTFDGLLRIAKQVLAYLENPTFTTDDNDDNLPA